MFFTVRPKASAEARVRVRGDGACHSPAARGYNIADAEAFWDRTNREDCHIREQRQLRVSSRHGLAGSYSPHESIPAAWDREYLRVMGQTTGLTACALATRGSAGRV